jgi:hypothetical protein
VKKITAIIFLSLYLFSATELRQLVKFPLLVQHYREHLALNHSITLIQFLCLHYNDKTVIDDDYAKDMQLPFKSHDDCYSISFNAINTNCFSVTVEKPVIRNNKEHIIFNDDFIYSVFLSSIWQPPRPFIV